MNTGDYAWVSSFAGDDTVRIFCTSAYARGGYDYFAGFCFDSTHSRAKMRIWKLLDATGDTVWTSDYTGSYNGYSLASAILVDDSGNVYVAGTEQANLLDFKLTMLKYNSSGNLIWSGSYDSAGMYNGAVAMALDEGKTVYATGFSGSGFASWDFITVGFSIGNGHLQGVARSPNANGSFSRPVGIAKDLDHNIYITGTSAASGGITTIKTIKYDSTFQAQWIRTWIGSGVSAEAADMKLTSDFGSIAITGTVKKANGGLDFVTLKYDTVGTLEWSKNISAPNPASAATGRSIAVTDEQIIYVAGSVFNGVDSDIIVASYDLSGNLRWTKNYKRANNTNDYPSLIVASDDGSVGVAGTSNGTVRYTFF